MSTEMVTSKYECHKTPLTLIDVLDCSGDLQRASCGDKPERPKLRKRMVGGTNVSLGVWPWHVSILHRFNSSAPFKHHCEGTIIQSQWVVSAAACFFKKEHVIRSDLIVKAGTVNLQEDGPETQVAEIAQIIRHKYFNPVSLQHNIALLRLSAPLEFNSAVQEICTPDEFTGDHSYSSCHITGFNKQGVLQEGWVEPIPNIRCNKRTWWNFRVTTNMECAGRYGGGTDGCDINIGGPLNCFLPLQHRYFIFGIRVVGDLCGVPQRPNIYLVTKRYYLWLEKYTTAAALHPLRAAHMFTLALSLFSADILTY
ncbi:elastase-1-like isoform X2 [Hoplias malabaricus]|uniref:elastase-1-like isoform X2 n=1 Tax=Hoplias malabaricus TaxID=27720 RepID=UPI0034621CF9